MKKKLAILFAVIFCVLPLFTACGTQSSAESAAEAAFKARYVDFDYEDYYDVAYRYNLDLISDVLKDASNIDDIKASVRDARDSIKDTIKAAKKATKDEDIKKWKINYDVRYSIVYDKDSDMYDALIADFRYSNTDFEDEISKVGIVGIAYEVSITDTDGDKYVTGDYKTYYCYKIDGKWYVD